MTAKETCKRCGAALEIEGARLCPRCGDIRREQIRKGAAIVGTLVVGAVLFILSGGKFRRV